MDIQLGNARYNASAQGSQRLQTIIIDYLEKWEDSQNPITKNRITREVVSTLTENSGSFIKFDETQHRWIEVDDSIARSGIPIHQS